MKPKGSVVKELTKEDLVMIKDYLESDLSYKEVGEKYGIRPDTLRYRVNKYRKGIGCSNVKETDNRTTEISGGVSCALAGENSKNMKQKIQIIIDDGVVSEVRADADTKKYLKEKNIAMEIVNFDSDSGDREKLDDLYNEHLAEIEYDILYCDDQDEET